ncbi:ribonuclease P protein component [Patescibacteria group bacterium]
MLPKPHRMKPNDISLVFQNGKFISYHGLNMRYVKKNLSAPRLAIRVPLSTSKKAVVRNRIKRLLRESIRILIDRLKGADIVIVVKKDISKSKQRDVQKIIIKLFEKAGIFKKL